MINPIDLTDLGAMVVVVWVDSNLLREQAPPSESPDPTTITSVGVVTALDKDWVTIARDCMSNGQYRDYLAIPSRCIDVLYNLAVCSA